MLPQFRVHPVNAWLGREGERETWGQGRYRIRTLRQVGAGGGWQLTGEPHLHTLHSNPVHVDSKPGWSRVADTGVTAQKAVNGESTFPSVFCH